MIKRPTHIPMKRWLQISFWALNAIILMAMLTFALR